MTDILELSAKAAGKRERHGMNKSPEHRAWVHMNQLMRETGMDDTSLLEGAARAMGRSIKGWNAQRGIAVAILDDDTFWQPLFENHITDCMGDALRLAVKLLLDVDVGLKSTFVTKDFSDGLFVEDHNGDPYAATRRAIVRSAAEIGKGMA